MNWEKKTMKELKKYCHDAEIDMDDIAMHGPLSKKATWVKACKEHYHRNGFSQKTIMQGMKIRANLSRHRGYRLIVYDSDGNELIKYNRRTNDIKEVAKVLNSIEAEGADLKVEVRGSSLMSELQEALRDDVKTAEIPKDTRRGKIPLIGVVTSTHPNMQSFSGLAQLAGITEDLLKPDLNAIVFVPADEAFEELPSEMVQYLAGRPELLKAILMNHVVPITPAVGKGFLASISGDELTTLAGDTIEINSEDIVEADIVANNGIVHIIDTIYMPESVGFDFTPSKAYRRNPSCYCMETGCGTCYSATPSWSDNYMVPRDIHEIVQSADRLERMWNSGTEYPEWWKSKLSVAADRVDGLADTAEYIEEYGSHARNNPRWNPDGLVAYKRNGYYDDDEMGWENYGTGYRKNYWSDNDDDDDEEPCPEDYYGDPCDYNSEGKCWSCGRNKDGVLEEMFVDGRLLKVGDKILIKHRDEKFGPWTPVTVDKFSGNYTQWRYDNGSTDFADLEYSGYEFKKPGESHHFDKWESYYDDDDDDDDDWYGSGYRSNPLEVYAPSKQDIENSKAAIRAEYPNVQFTGDIVYLVNQSGSSNKYHAFFMTSLGGFNTYARIGYKPKVVGPMSAAAWNNKIGQKRRKGYDRVEVNAAVIVPEAEGYAGKAMAMQYALDRAEYEDALLDAQTRYSLGLASNPKSDLIKKGAMRAKDYIIEHEDSLRRAAAHGMRKGANMIEPRQNGKMGNLAHDYIEAVADSEEEFDMMMEELKDGVLDLPPVQMMQKAVEKSRKYAEHEAHNVREYIPDVMRSNPSVAGYETTETHGGKVRRYDYSEDRGSTEQAHAKVFLPGNRKGRMLVINKKHNHNDPSECGWDMNYRRFDGRGSFSMRSDSQKWTSNKDAGWQNPIMRALDTTENDYGEWLTKADIEFLTEIGLWPRNGDAMLKAFLERENYSRYKWEFEGGTFSPNWQMAWDWTIEQPDARSNPMPEGKTFMEWASEEDNGHPDMTFRDWAKEEADEYASQQDHHEQQYHDDFMRWADSEINEDTHSTRQNPKEVFPGRGQYGIYDYYKETGDINTKKMVKHLSRKYKRKGMDYDKLERQINRIIKRNSSLSKMVEETNILLEENNLPVKTWEVKRFGKLGNPADYYWRYQILPKDTDTRQNPTKQAGQLKPGDYIDEAEFGGKVLKADEWCDDPRVSIQIHDDEDQRPLYVSMSATDSVNVLNRNPRMPLDGMERNSIGLPEFAKKAKKGAKHRRILATQHNCPIEIVDEIHRYYNDYATDNDKAVALELYQEWC